jgi:hypothetical protein
VPAQRLRRRTVRLKALGLSERGDLAKVIRSSVGDRLLHEVPKLAARRIPARVLCGYSIEGIGRGVGHLGLGEAA